MQTTSATKSVFRSGNGRDGRLANQRTSLAAAATAAGLLGCCLLGCGSSSQNGHDADTMGVSSSGGHDGGAAGSSAGGAVGTGGRDAGTAADTAAGDAGSAAARLGLACNADADCGAGLQCLKATDKVIGAAGGPAHGYCSTPCVQAVVDPCAPIGGVCFDYQPGTAGPPLTYCMKTCVFGGTAVSDRVAKCQNRPDVACTQESGVALCLPTCSQDSDCPSTRKCDLQFNLCVDTPPTGDPMGVHCAANATTGASACAGICLQFGTATMINQALCSSRCVLGELGACNWVDQTMSIAGGTHGVCAFASANNAFNGDLGFCTLECDSNAGCPDTVDHAFCDLTIQADIGHGACSFQVATPDGGVDGGRG